MASSRIALRLLRRSVPSSTSSAPRLARSIATTPYRTNTQSKSSSSPEAVAASENKTPFSSSQVAPPSPHPGTSLSSLRPSPLSPHRANDDDGTSSRRRRDSSSAAVPAISRTDADEQRPPYQYPPQDPTPLPSVHNSFDPALSQSSIAAALNAAPSENTIDWGTSYHGLSVEPFAKEAQQILQAPIPMDDVEVKPDGIIYLPEIKYRRILNSAFGPGGWGLAPRGELHVGEKVVTREFALVVGGRFVAQARGECGYYGEDNIPNAVEGCKSNALTRCCKDLGIASELWDPRFIRKYMKEFTKQVDVYYGMGVSARKKRITIRKDDEVVPPFRLLEPPRTASSSSSSTYSKPASGSYGSSNGARPATSTATKTTSTAAKSTATAAKSTMNTAAKPAAAKTTTTASKA
ncbi:hypothetical protein MKZ38_004560 [Zalerion maritima]|uniref:Mitochondrial genome maintenance protein MGM101 n=1 Tax=Zalerion maritima TaxID=339359 RepID=A0AAD5RLG7_9PEZI|nr:hypothetical protein MKZ38_004560 [Zalerion maritima]